MLKNNRRYAAYIALATTCLTVSSASAQQLGGAAGQAQAQVQQRTQAQVQQQVQAQVQQKTQAQAQERAQGQVAAGIQSRIQGRIQVNADRAVGIAQRAAQRIDAGISTAREHVPQGVKVQAGANPSTQGRLGSRNRSAQADSQSSLGAQAAASLPPGISEADVSLYDNIFGRFNPLRSQATAGAEATNGEAVASDSPRRGSQAGKRKSQRDEVKESEDTTAQSTLSAGIGATANASSGFASRVVFAAQQRRAEISQIRDQAFASGDTALMVRADEMEQQLNAFAEASSRARFAEVPATTPNEQQAPEATVASRPQDRVNGSAKTSAKGKGSTQVR